MAHTWLLAAFGQGFRGAVYSCTHDGSGRIPSAVVRRWRLEEGPWPPSRFYACAHVVHFAEVCLGRCAPERSPAGSTTWPTGINRRERSRQKGLRYPCVYARESRISGKAPQMPLGFVRTSCRQNLGTPKGNGSCDP